MAFSPTILQDGKELHLIFGDMVSQLRTHQFGARLDGRPVLRIAGNLVFSSAVLKLCVCAAEPSLLLPPSILECGRMQAN